MNAIRFRLQLGGVAKPILDLESCNGCGACLSVCPTKAIKFLILKQIQMSQFSENENWYVCSIVVQARPEKNLTKSKKPF